MSESTRVYPRLPDLPDLLKQTAPHFSPWLLALLLGHHRPGEQPPVVGLRTQDGLDEILQQLDDAELLAVPAARGGALGKLPTAQKIEKQYRDGRRTYLAAAPVTSALGH